MRCVTYGVEYIWCKREAILSSFEIQILQDPITTYETYNLNKIHLSVLCHILVISPDLIQVPRDKGE